MTYQESYKEGCNILKTAGIEEASLDARLLLEFVCQTDRNTLLVHGDREVSLEEETSYKALLEKRKEHVPLQHLTGFQEFMGLRFEVNEHVLIPRQDTEVLVEEVMKHLHDGMRFLDMCTGSGCILLSLLHYSNECEGVGVDYSEEALTVAKRNAHNLFEKADLNELEKQFGLQDREPAQKQVTFVHSDLFKGVEGTFDIIVSNPPYIATEVCKTLMSEVKDYEPRMALDGGEDGLHFYRRIIKESPAYLNRGGIVFFEIGFDQAGAVSSLMEQEGFKEVTVLQDFAGLDRVVYGTYY